MIEKLKLRWGITSNFQVIIILLVFAITGSTTVYLKKMIFDLLNITTDTHLLIKIPLYVIVVLAVYNLLLLVIGFIFGQFRFFLEFEKKFFSRIFFRRKQATEKVLNK